MRGEEGEKNPQFVPPSPILSSVFSLQLPERCHLLEKRAHAVSHVEARPSPNFNKACPSVGIIQPCHLSTCRPDVTLQARFTSLSAKIRHSSARRAQSKQPAQRHREWCVRLVCSEMRSDKLNFFDRVTFGLLSNRIWNLTSHHGWSLRYFYIQVTDLFHHWTGNHNKVVLFYWHSY